VLCDRFAERSGLDAACDVAEQLPPLSPDAELVIYRIAQESLTNIARHSGSTSAELRLQTDDGHVALTVRDKGNGLPSDYIPGSGIRGMRERAALIGATLDIRNADPGTEVRLRAPVEVAA
jgi:two-component system sensor histidine kinase UhpB